MGEDHRVSNDDAVKRQLDMLTATVTVGRQQGKVVAYPVAFEGHIVTAIGYVRGPDEIVPVCIVLDEESWENVPQVSLDHGYVKEMPDANV